jgi:HEAT repeat protein
VARGQSLEAQLSSGTDRKHAEAALALAEHDSPAGASALTEALSDPSLEVRAAAELALASLYDPASIAALRTLAAVLTLFPAESQGPLARALRTATAPAIRRRAATALGACRHGAGVEALVAALEDPAADVPAAAARSLGDMRDPVTAGALKAAGGNGDETVRQAAKSALRKLGTVGRPQDLAGSFGVLAQRSPG